MDGCSISQAAERTGFTASALRFYEDRGLVQPHRTPAGYRTYDPQQLDQLSFIRRAKGFGLTLEEITELLDLLDGEQCTPVQARLRDLVDAKISDAQVRIGELVSFTSELQRVSAGLDRHTPDGPCDDACGCTSDGAGPVGHMVGVALSSGRAGGDAPPIACTLHPGAVEGRVADWQGVLAEASQRRPIDGGVRAVFPASVDIGTLATLASAEQDCCSFFTFTITIDREGVVLDITGPPDAQPVIGALVGLAA